MKSILVSERVFDVVREQLIAHLAKAALAQQADALCSMSLTQSSQLMLKE